MVHQHAVYLIFELCFLVRQFDRRFCDGVSLDQLLDLGVIEVVCDGGRAVNKPVLSVFRRAFRNYLHGSHSWTERWGRASPYFIEGLEGEYGGCRKEVLEGGAHTEQVAVC